MHPLQPLYLHLYDTGELAERVAIARDVLASCTLCGHECKVNRLVNEVGKCCSASRARVYGAHPHFGEEPPLVGWRGSGTIFFSHCNMQCQFCQNYELSRQGEGDDVTADQLARMMLRLQDEGCHNINLVSPTHQVPMILDALMIAIDHGLRIPLVYNTGGYDSLQLIQMLDRVIDIYLPDMKFADADVAERLSGAVDYPAVNQAAVKEMHRQVGDLVIDDRGIARRGLLVRHMLMPNGLAGTEGIARFLAEAVSTRTVLNLMNQFVPPPCGGMDADLCQNVSDAEFQKALAACDAAGLERVMLYAL